jgi:exopolyphosphatase/guanosine-5'-triphosphate,3'-diphosphate pyrophosphatase
MRVAVVDIGTNSTRLLIADVDGHGRVSELDRRSRVTRLGDGVDATGLLSDAAIERVLAALDEYSSVIGRFAADARPAVLTSAVRDAANGPEFVATVERRYGLEARAIPGSEEAQLTYLGATSTPTSQGRS